MTPLQERKLNQYKQEIALLEKQVHNKGLIYSVRIAWIICMFSYFFYIFFEVILEDKTLLSAIQDYGWKSIIVDILFWLFIVNFLFIKGTKSYIKSRRKEMEAYERKLAKEAAF